MPTLTLTLSGQPVDLPADAAVALSYRVNDLRNLDGREAAFSETFTLPLTARNVAVLGVPHALDSLTSAPYVQLPAVLTSPGGVVLLRGFALLESAGDGYEVILTNAIGSLFVQVGERTLRELDLEEYGHAFTFDSVRAAESHDYTKGYTYALADDGRLTRRTAEKGILFYELRSAVYYHAVLCAIVKQALPGWGLAGSLLEEETYQLAALPQATAYPQVSANTLLYTRASATLFEPVTYSGRGPQGQQLTAPQFTVEDDPGGNLFAGAYFTTPNYYCDLTVKVRLRAQVRRVPGSNITYVTSNALIRDTRFEQAPVILDKGQIAVGQSGVFGFQEFFNHPVTDTFSAPSYTEFTIKLTRLDPRTQLALLVPLFVNVETKLLLGSGVTWQVEPRAYPGSPVGLAGSLPDISQVDFLRMVFNQFNTIVQSDEVTRRVQFDLFNDLERNRRRAVDWTDKLDLTTRPKLTYRLGDYAQRNALAYDAPPEAYATLGSLAPVPTASADLPVQNETLPATAEAYTAPVFLPQVNASLGGPFALAWLPFFEVPTDFKSIPERWDAVKTYGDSEQLVVYGDTVWKGRALVAGTVPGRSRAQQDGEWLRQEYDVANEELNTVVLLSPLNAPAVLQVPVYDDAPSASKFLATRRLLREGLEFDALLKGYYQSLMQVLKRVQLLSVDVRLNALDIAQLDFTLPIKLNLPHVQGYGQLRCLAYLNEIEQYQPGLPSSVTCTLLVLGLAVPSLAPSVPMPLLRAFATEDAAYYALTEQEQYLLVE
jgi:hypothetical protein